MQMPVAARKRLVVVGNGMAGLKLLEELEAACPGRYSTTVVGAEPDAAYNRVLLSSLLAGDVAADDIMMRPRAWYEERGVELRTGVTASGIEGQRVMLSNGDVIAFDKLVLAT